MMLPKVFLFALLMVLTSAQDYSDDQGATAQHLAPNYAHPDYHHHHNHYEEAKAEPYDFGFQSTDEFGTVMNRQEASDSNGAVRGSYGYTDPYGVFRHVDYIADEYGFRAQVKSNEPGMGSQSPANVEIYAEAPPAGLVIERPYVPHHPHPQASSQAQSAQVPPQRRNPSGQQQGGSGRQVGQGSSRRPSQTASGAGGQGASSGAFGAQSGQYGAQSGQYGAQSGQYGAQSGQYGAQSGQYGASSGGFGAGAASSSTGSRHVHAAGPFSFVPTRHNPYPSSSGSSEPAIRYGGPSPYPPRSNYGQQHASIHYNPQSASAAASSALSSTTTTQQTSASSSSANAAAGGYRYSEGEKVEGGSSIILPTVVTSGVPTLVKHIHTYPVAAA